MDWKKIADTQTLLRAGYAGMFFFLPVATSPTVVCGVFVLGAWIFSGRFIPDAKIWQRSVLLAPIALLIALPWAGLLYTPVPDDGFHIAVKTYYWLFAFAMAGVLRESQKPDLVIRMFLAGLALNSLIAILQFSGALPLKKGLATGLLGGSSAHIVFSLLLVTGVLIASFYVHHSQTPAGRSLSVLAILLYCSTLAFVGGRSGYAAIILLSPLIVHNLIGKRHALLVILMSALAVALLFASPVVRDRFSKAGEEVIQYRQGRIDTSVGLRFHLWEVALGGIKERPVAGTGTGGFRRLWEEKKQSPGLPFHDHPHNSYLFFAVSYGIVGGIAFVWLLGRMAATGWNRRTAPLGFSVISFTAVFAIGSLTDTQVLPFATAMALPLFAGMSEAVRGL